jgi:hypothetical protein
VDPIAGLINLVNTHREPYFNTDFLIFQWHHAGHNLGLRIERENPLTSSVVAAEMLRAGCVIGFNSRMLL